MEIGNITFDAQDPPTLCAFWAAALGYEEERLPDHLAEKVVEALGPDGLREKAAARHPEGRGPRLWFQRVLEGKAGKNRVHLDLKDADASAEVERLVGLGATIVETRTDRVGDFSDTYTVMQDPEGNEFCVMGPNQPTEGYL